METSRTQQDQSRNAAIAALERVAEVAAARGDHAAAERARAIIGRLRADLFNLAFVGQFKRGKTTLINALLGRDLLPAAVVPLTSVVTIIEYGVPEAVIIHFEDGSSREIAAQELADYVTERGNPSNRRRVSAAVVRLPCPLLSTGLRIIDTPGVGSVHAHNTETAYAFIPHVDAAVFLVTADPPISQAELQFLHDLRKEVERIFFVQNKIDQVAPEDRRESLDFSRAQLASALGEDEVRMFSLSAKDALTAKLTGNARGLEQSGLGEFEAALAEFARSEKSETAVSAALRAVDSLVRQQQAAIALERAALAMPLEELEEKRAQFEAYLSQMRQTREDSRHLLRAASERLVSEVVDRDLAELQDKQRPLLIAGLRQTADENSDLSGHALLDRLNAYVRSSIQAVYEDWIAREEQRITEALRGAVDRFTGQVNHALSELARISSELFHAQVGDLTVVADLGGRREFYFAPWQMQVSPDVLAGSILHLLPGRWVRPRLLAAAEAKLVEQLDMHGGRVRYDFVRRLQESLREYERGIVEAMDATIAGIDEAIRRAVAQRRRTAEEVSARQRELAIQEQSLLSVADETGRGTWSRASGR
jgi:small GTP-binding protein